MVQHAWDRAMAKHNGASAEAAAADTITIKKYANRRLYNTNSSSYITLEDLASMVRENIDFHVRSFP